MEKKLKILSKMITKNANVLGDNNHVSLWRGFYDFQNLVELDTKDYENLLKEMRHEGLITIDMNGANDFKYARIIATKQGIEYLLNHQQ